MSKANFKCECGETTEVSFTVGKKPQNPVCVKCGKEMHRVFHTVGVGDIVSDEFLEIGRMMTYHSPKK